MAIKRRDFLKLMTSASFSWPLVDCQLKTNSRVDLQNSWSSNLETWVPTVCGACPGSCGLIARKIDNRVVKLEGNPLHPLNRGKICARSQASVQLLYNSTRVKTPLLKVGRRSSGKWRQISWEEGLSIVASKLTELRNSGKAHTVVYLGAQGNQLADELISRFLRVYGSPNDIRIDLWRALKQAYSFAFGSPELLAFDFENCRYILSFSSQFLTNWPTSVEIQRIYGAKRSKGELKLVQIEPRFSLEASRADRWVPIKPGKEGLLALGIASIILKEQLYDKNYLDRFGARFEEWLNEAGKKIPGFKASTLNLVRLENISEETAVPLKTIIEIAREFATNRPALAIADFNLSYHPHGLLNSLAVLSLNALVGSIDNPGGLVRSWPAPLRPWPQEKLDAIAERGLLHPPIDAPNKDWLLPPLANPPYEINCLLLSPQPLPGNFPFLENWEEISQKIPLIISFEPYLNPRNEHVDLILPDTTFYEKWQLAPSPSLSMKTAVSVGMPVVNPLYQSRPFEDVLIALAKKISGHMADSFPWKNHAALIIERLAGLFEARRGTVFLPPQEEFQLRLLEERGWWFSQHRSLNDFMADLFKKGGWYDPVYHFQLKSNIYKNPERKFVFFPVRENLIKQTRPRPAEPAYPLQLFLYDLPFTSTNSGAQMPFFQENLGFRFNCEWRNWVEINPEKAEELKIKENDLVWVESPHGKIRAVAKLFPGLAPGLLAIPLNKEISFPANGENRKIFDPLALLPDSGSIQKNFSVRQDLELKIYKDEGGTE